MKKEDLIKLKEKISKLSDEEKKLRDLYLRKISLGELYGPMTGYPSIDKPWLKYYAESGILADIPKKRAYDLIYNKYHDNKKLIALNYFGVKINLKTWVKVKEDWQDNDSIVNKFKLK